MCGGARQSQLAAFPGRHAPMARMTLDVNGKVQTIDADPDMPLLYALRNELSLNNPHFGCGLAQCGACTVHVDGQARGRDDGLREATMTRQDNATHVVSRRSLLKAGGALVVSIGTPVAFDTVLGIGEAFAQGAKPPLTPDQLSSYIAVNADGTVSAFFGKMDMGQGLFVAIGQMVAEELDVPFKAVTVIMGD